MASEPTIAFQPDLNADPRSVDELLAAILGSNSDEDQYWDDVWAVQKHGTRDVLDRADVLGRSLCPHERRTGAAILGQLGVRLGAAPVFSDERLDSLLDMLAVECDDQVLASILSGLGHLKRAEAVGPVLAHLAHPNDDVRYAVVHALLTHTDPRAIAGLITLSRDEEVSVRDWATFGLGSMVEVDTPELRQALVDRLDDEDGDTRVEAMVGLGRLRDPRVLLNLQADLAAGLAGPMELEAVTLIGVPELLPLLVALRGRDDVDQADLDAAILACTPRSDP